ncbi:transposon Ty3-I Gag-Pol polyprotein [Nephila pilipes]|uniref:Transposon Ty3-I Gag-Pol polyprotein n=1 Tax=Nephila pilipes TaxID=299642 RepID=A0A8X6N075_NEPPI|nr:transposon Ty3-I Gag-Pol polyprotein [Nephila pilipes]
MVPHAGSHLRHCIIQTCEGEQGKIQLRLQGNLPTEIATVVCDIIMQPGSTDSYSELKKQIIARYSEKLHDKQMFSPIYLVNPYNQISINSSDVQETAKCTHFGLFESFRMQFGIYNSSTTFQRFIDEVTKNLPFVDDSPVASKNKTEHIEYFNHLFSKLSELSA